MAKTIKTRPPRKGRKLFRRWQLEVQTKDGRTLRGMIESISFTKSKCSKTKPVQRTGHVTFTWLASLEQGVDRLVWKRQKRRYMDMLLGACRTLTFKETLKIEFASWKWSRNMIVFTSTLDEEGTLFPPRDSSNLLWKGGEFVPRPAKKIAMHA
ncbi:MAG: hypothetical protein COV91_05395 [Candidatus Taylorbacteria bacterium CG11_big_fil_rev_8_21_14_0_20_46_11]|uniref:Uncharacterized protein n=1 Tax=Candidatus Taylorbacteria bacterium CG11_big_fil_rev_8_21_14_0_20_46_11 TaxID=1975025 RepID=A0A2H0KCS8_9BACT|nr:MAG: hypothetical protein COV91_05395 [Candidatus Taylorbacteria bacterium CG11_big_fil_rev_8_21_14_0_20_46_11]